jgi:translation elongation factor aEF-1 beta
MAGKNGAKYKLMPESPETDLDAIQTAAKMIVEDFGGDNKEYEIQPIAFGLKAIIVFFFYDETKSTDHLEEEFSKIPGVASAQLIDMRKVA